jgi:hypothetical protein
MGRTKILIRDEIPFKLILIHKLTKKQYDFYRSTTDYIAYDEDCFSCEEKYKETSQANLNLYQMPTV